MKYEFECELCKTQAEIDIPMNEYEDLKDKQSCPRCSGKMKRILAWQGCASLCSGMYGIDNKSGGSWNV